MKDELKEIEWKSPVNKSSQILAIGVCRDYPNTMYVKFQSGGVYAYDGATFDDYRGLRHAASPGSHFHTHIKDVFPHRKLA